MRKAEQAGPTPVRRVITSNDAQGRSRVFMDGIAPNAIGAPVGPGRGMMELWNFHEMPVDLSDDMDMGNRPYNFEPSPTGAHLRIVQNIARPADYDPARDPMHVPPHEPKQRQGGNWDNGTWDKGGANAYSAGNHKTYTVDYGIMLEGERILGLDDRELVMHPGDVVVQLGNWHSWSSPRLGCRMAFVMMGAVFDGPPATGAFTRPILSQYAKSGLFEGARPVRRIVTIDKQDGTSTAVTDGPCPDVRLDPARPGFAATRIWVTGSTPAKIAGIVETLHLPHTIEPPPNGSVCRFLTLPPDDTWRGRVGEPEVRAYFQAMGSPRASTYSPRAPHPYMQKTRTLDLCIVIEGEVTLVLDTEEVHLKPLDVVIQRGTNHAWSNRSGRPVTIAISSHDGRF